jgi:hypothetical protein
VSGAATSSRDAGISTAGDAGEGEGLDRREALEFLSSGIDRGVVLEFLSAELRADPPFGAAQHAEQPDHQHLLERVVAAARDSPVLQRRLVLDERCDSLRWP